MTHTDLSGDQAETSCLRCHRPETLGKQQVHLPDKNITNPVACFNVFGLWDEPEYTERSHSYTGRTQVQTQSGPSDCEATVLITTLHLLISLTSAFI